MVYCTHAKTLDLASAMTQAEIQKGVLPRKRCFNIVALPYFILDRVIDLLTIYWQLIESLVLQNFGNVARMSFCRWNGGDTQR